MTRFFASRWRGELPLRTVLGRDMLLVGSALNLLATFIALLAASQGAPGWVAMLIHFSPLPYNLFLVGAVRRAAPGHRLVGLLSLVWLLVITVV